MELFLVILTGLFSLGGVWLGSWLSKRRVKTQSLMETKISSYGRLLSAIRSEGNYPHDIAGSVDSYHVEKVAEYNRKVEEWRRSRNAIKGLVAEAFLITQNKKLRDKLSTFISSRDPDNILNRIEDLMREEIEI